MFLFTPLHIVYTSSLFFCQFVVKQSTIKGKGAGWIYIGTAYIVFEIRWMSVEQKKILIKDDFKPQKTLHCSATCQQSKKAIFKTTQTHPNAYIQYLASPVQDSIQFFPHHYIGSLSEKHTERAQKILCFLMINVEIALLSLENIGIDRFQSLNFFSKKLPRKWGKIYKK